jgi:hypothetical protein
MKKTQLAGLMTSLLGLALVLGLLVVNVNAQTSAPPAQQEEKSQPSPAPGATDRGAAPQPTAPETRAPSAPPAPNVTIENRGDTRTGGDERGKFLGVDPTVAMVVGAALLIVIVIALVAMTRRSEDVPTHRSI